MISSYNHIGNNYRWIECRKTYSIISWVLPFKHDTNDSKPFIIGIVPGQSFFKWPILVDVFHVDVYHLHFHIISIKKCTNIFDHKNIYFGKFRTHDNEVLIHSYGFPSIVCSDWVTFSAPNLKAIFQRKYFAHFPFLSVNGPPLMFGHRRWGLLIHLLNGFLRFAPIVHCTRKKWCE